MRTSVLLPEHHALLEAFGAYEHAVDGLAAPTRRNHRICLQALLRWWERERAGRPLSGAHTADLTGFLVAEAARGPSPRTRKGGGGGAAAVLRVAGADRRRGARPGYGAGRRASGRRTTASTARSRSGRSSRTP